MDVFIFFILFFLGFLDIEALDANCPSVKCSHSGPDIQFPFRVQGQHAQHCGHPGFELFCKLNKTTIHFPAYGDLVVKSISYDAKKLNLLDPKNCVHEVFLNLNLALTPFQYYYVVKNYTYLNCSARLSPSFVQVPCLSGSEYHVYVVESSLDVPLLCKPVKTAAIPLSYTPFLSDNSFGLGLTWDEDSEEKEGWYKFSGLGRCFNTAYGKVLGIIIFIFMVATMNISAKTYFFKKLDMQSEKKKDQVEVEKLLGETFKLKIYSGSHVKGESNQIKTAFGHRNYPSDSEGKLPNDICVCTFETNGNHEEESAITSACPSKG